MHIGAREGLQHLPGWTSSSRHTRLSCRRGLLRRLLVFRVLAQHRAHVVTALAQTQPEVVGFHHQRLAAGAARPFTTPLQIAIRAAERDCELQALAALRAQAFYAYPPERAFAGRLHQLMKAEEELAALRAARESQRARDRQAAAAGGSGNGAASSERSVSLAAVCCAAVVPGLRRELLLPREPDSGGRDALRDGKTSAELASAGGRQGPASSGDADAGAAAGAEEAGRRLAQGLQAAEDNTGVDAVVGSLDMHAVRALPGEVLIGNCANAAYLANVCCAAEARRRGVGAALLAHARELAADWGVEGLYVHIMAANSAACSFYTRAGFVVEAEEAANAAAARGHCLDGISGAGRTVLLRDAALLRTTSF